MNLVLDYPNCDRSNYQPYFTSGLPVSLFSLKETLEIDLYNNLMFIVALWNVTI